MMQMHARGTAHKRKKRPGRSLSSLHRIGTNHDGMRYLERETRRQLSIYPFEKARLFQPCPASVDEIMD